MFVIASEAERRTRPALRAGWLVLRVARLVPPSRSILAVAPPFGSPGAFRGPVLRRVATVLTIVQAPSTGAAAEGSEVAGRSIVVGIPAVPGVV